MQITIEYAAQAKEAAGIPFETMDVSPSSGLQNFAEAACRSRGEKLCATLMDARGRLHRSILILVNEFQVFHEDKLKLSEGDRIMFLPPVSGG